MAMFKLTERLEFRLTQDVVGFLLDPAVIVGAVEKPHTITRVSPEVLVAEVRGIFGARRLEVRASADAGGGTVICQQTGKTRWSYSVRWSTIPGSATAEIILEFASAENGLKPKAKRLLEELKATVLNGRIQEHYTTILDYFKGEHKRVWPAKPEAAQAGGKREGRLEAPAEQLNPRPFDKT